MKIASRTYQYINILSIDVVIGAIISSLFFGRLLNHQLSNVVLIALGLTVWMIYTVDHLRDARNIKGVASTDRHRFHQRYFKKIVWVLLAVIVVDVVAISLLPPDVVIAGFILGFAVLLYLMLQRSLKFMKEFFVAVLYTAGVLMPSVSDLDDGLLIVHYITIAQFAITALMNLLLFSLFDHEVDRSDRQHSFVTWFGPRLTSTTIFLLGVLNIVSGIWMWTVDVRVAVVFIAMNMMLLGILFLKHHLVHNNYYRIMGDAVFFIPVICLI